jgi:hypothetical protein
MSEPRQDWREEPGPGLRRTPDGALDDEALVAAQMRHELRLVPRYKPEPPPDYVVEETPMTPWPPHPTRPSLLRRLVRSVRRLFLG